jgi:hypothetical protein
MIMKAAAVQARIRAAAAWSAGENNDVRDEVAEFVPPRRRPLKLPMLELALELKFSRAWRPDTSNPI